jgi:transposase
MPRIKVIELSAAEQTALEHGYQQGSSHAFRQRCQMILLKSQGRTASQVAGIVGVCEMSVHNWMHRYEDQGFAGLQTKAGRGRKAILQEDDLESVQATVARHRQRLSVAKAELEQALGKSFCQETLTRFIKKTVLSISDCANVPARSRCRSFTNSKSKA